MLGAVGARMHDELVNNAAALRAWDAEDTGGVPAQAVLQIRRRGMLSLWSPIFFEALPRRPR